MYKKLIVLTGGGSGGPVTPLLAVFDSWKYQGEDFAYLWLGTKNGPERQMVEAEGIEFRAIPSGKLRRYFDWQNFFDLFRLIAAFFLCLYLFVRRRPDVVLSAGSFASVPPVWAAWILQVPVIVHQQDVRPGLANRLMAPLAAVVTVAFAKSRQDFRKRSVWIGNPVRARFRDYRISRREAVQKLGISEHNRTVLVMGGGTGAQAINDLVWTALPELSKYCQIIHITGQGKQKFDEDILANPNYRSFEFLDIKGMAKVFAVADLVVSRCGLGTLTELSCLGLPAILIPIPASHQEENAEIFWKEEAALVLDQNELNARKFVKSVKYLLDSEELREKFSGNIRKVMKDNAAEAMGEIVKRIVNAVGDKQS